MAKRGRKKRDPYGVEKGPVSHTRQIGKKSYSLAYRGKNKAKAKTFAKSVRKKGASARVIKTKGHYNVYNRYRQKK